MKTTRATRLAFVLLAFLPSVAGAGLILDQFQSDQGVPADSGAAVYANEGSIQTFTVGVTGLLAAVDLRAFTFPRTIPGAPPGSVFNSSILATVRRLDGTGTPIWTDDGRVASTSFMPPTIQPGDPTDGVPWRWHWLINPLFGVPPEQYVTAGERLAFVFEDPVRGGGTATLMGTSAATYQGGGLFTSYLLDHRQDPITPDPTRAIFFRTWVEPPLSPWLPTDINLDGAGSLTDFGILKANFGRTDAGWTDGDLTIDGKVDLSDFAVFKDNFDRPGGLAPVPEPAGWVLAAIAAMFAFVRRATD